MSWPDLLEQSQRSYSFYCKNLATNKVVRYGETVEVETASVIKLPILICLLQQVQTGELSLQQPMTVLKRHVGRDGSGIIQYFDLSQPQPLFNLAFLMIAESDNVATNVIIELLGKDAINQFISDTLQLSQTKLIMNFFDFSEEIPPAEQPIGHTTSFELATLIEKLLSGELLDELHTKLALSIMKQTSTDHFCRRLPQATFKTWGNKTGSITFEKYPDVVLNDVGYIITKANTYYSFAMFMHGATTNKTITVDADYKVEFANLAKAIFTELKN